MTAVPSAGPALPGVLILTPVKSAARYLDSYFRQIERLTYPKERLSIGLLEGDSRDGTWPRLQSLRASFRRRCRRVTLLQRDFSFQIPDGVPRWTPAYQLARRTTLARARNHLLFGALRDEDYVLWIDVDVIDFPSDMIETLIATGLDIVQPHCVTIPGGETFDCNCWTEHGTRHLDSYRGHASPVRLDSVGGTVLLVKADIHRDGLVFPPFRYGVANGAARPHHPVWGCGEIETEGLAIMAADMGIQCWGLPDYEVIHDSN
jgi:Anp1